MMISNHIYKTEKIVNIYLSQTKQDVKQREIAANYLEKIHEIRTMVIEDGQASMTLDYCFEFIEFNLIDPILKHLEKEHENTKSADLQYNLAQLELIGKYLKNVPKQDKHSIFNKPRDSAEWQRLNQHIHYVQVDDEESVAFFFSITEFLIRLGIALCSVQNECLIKQRTLPITVAQTITRASAMIFRRTVNEKTQTAFINPNELFVVRLMTNQDSIFVVRQLLKGIMTSIKTNKVIYIPRFYEEYSLHDINKDIDAGTVYQKATLKTKTFGLSSFDVSHKDFGRIPLRILSHRPHVFRANTSPQHVYKQWINHDETLPHVDSPIRTIVLHFHGGAWISTSSFFHQNYLRKWAKFLGEDTLILAPDYRKAPEHKYPSAHEDCWQAYLWVLNFAKFYLRTNLDKIIISGDSAGGNMAISTVFRAIKFGVRVPDGLYLIYPVPTASFDIEFLIICICRIRPSNLLGLVDRVQPSGVMLKALNCYIGSEGVRPASDPFLSPELASHAFLERFPNTITVVGDRDSLSDNCVHFTNRLLQSIKGSETAYPQIHIYKGFCHGFLCLDWPGIPLPFISKVTQDTCKLLKELIENS